MTVPDHLGCLQVFMIDRVEAAHERGLVMEVMPLAAYFLIRFGKQSDGLAPTLAALLATGDSTLRSF
jgi:hypothetical protein